MRRALRICLGTAAIALVAIVVFAPTAMGASAVDQYTEGIPTASGQKPSLNAVGGDGGGGGTAAISPQTQAKLQKTKKGSAADKAANITAPSASESGPSDSDGMGLLLPLILVAALATAVGVFLGRRRTGAAPS
jgi:hypothetical protein